MFVGHIPAVEIMCWTVNDQIPATHLSHDGLRQEFVIQRWRSIQLTTFKPW